MLQKWLQLKDYSPSDFVTEGLGGNDSDFLTYSFVSVEVKSQSSVVFLNDNLRRLLDGLSPDTTLKSKRLFSKYASQTIVHYRKTELQSHYTTFSHDH